MTPEEERELRAQLARLLQEHRDLDAAISALEASPGSDILQVQRELARLDLRRKQEVADQAQQLGLDPAEVLAFFYPTDDHASLRVNARPEGEWLLATYAGKAAGCGAFQRIDANTCELQYVYVRDEYRGKRIRVPGEVRGVPNSRRLAITTALNAICNKRVKRTRKRSGR